MRRLRIQAPPTLKSDTQKRSLVSLDVDWSESVQEICRNITVLIRSTRLSRSSDYYIVYYYDELDYDINLLNTINIAKLISFLNSTIIYSYL